jgi:hypothetical protein
LVEARRRIHEGEKPEKHGTGISRIVLFSTSSGNDRHRQVSATATTTPTKND